MVRWIALLCMIFVAGMLSGCGAPDEGLRELDRELASAAPEGQRLGGTGPAIKIVGSSTVAPFASTVAEQFGAATRYQTPIVETTGTGGGFKVFCEGAGPSTPSIANASRRITASELELCARAGVVDLVEIPIGFDGIAVVSSKQGPTYQLTNEVLYQALAADLPDGAGGWRANPHRRWSDVSADLPPIPILVSGPPPTSGTRDAFLTLALEPGAEAFPQLAALKLSDPTAFETRVHTLRSDGAWIDAGENDAAIIQTLIKNNDALGVLGFSFLDQNSDRVRAAEISGVAPTFETISSGEYSVSRSLYVYVKRQNAAIVPGLVDFLDAFTAEEAWGPSGYLAQRGLIPLPQPNRAAVRDEALSFKRMAGDGSGQ
ncbi:MAG: substrate-binding domain-containing protein [Pseudomonadota bacterium]